MNLKMTIKRLYLRAAGVHRIHIIGCSRSGTTMLHYAMIAFGNVRLSPAESSFDDVPWSAAMPPFKGLTYITKRDYGWFKEPDAVDLIKRERLGIINLIRDPRDVLVSRHAGTGDGEYVTLDHWRQSIEAGKRIIDGVRDHVPAITIRYEDVIREPASVERLIEQTFGLNRQSGMKPINHLRDNVQAADLPAEGGMMKALHKLRNFDDRSISSWSNDEGKRRVIERLTNEESLIDRFIVEHGF